jgi:hypothetical protein
VEPDPMNSPRRFEIHHDIMVIENVGASVSSYFELKRFVTNAGE